MNGFVWRKVFKSLRSMTGRRSPVFLVLQIYGCKSLVYLDFLFPEPLFESSFEFLFLLVDVCCLGHILGLMTVVDVSETLLSILGVGLTLPRDLRPFVATPSRTSVTCPLLELPAPGWKKELVEGVGTAE